MAISGKVYIAPLPDENKWLVLVENNGGETFGITQNVLPANNPELKQHDDHGRYGHGLPVDGGQVSYQKFEKGDLYNNQYPITEDCFLRVGIRNHAYRTVKLPKMTDPPLVLDIAEFNWYAGSPAQHNNAVQNWPGSKEYKPNAADGKATLTLIKELLERANTRGVKCEGKASVAAVKGQDGALSHWEVRFDNTGKQPWIGTCSFVRGAKNAGRGLEAMAVPTQGSGALQRIEAYTHYGVDAVPGEKLRLGVRGYSWLEVPLPADGAVEIPLEQFKLDTSKWSPEFFDVEQVVEKRNEKAATGRVQFFEGGKALNVVAEPKTWRGAIAKSRSTFDAPRLTVVTVKDGPETPGGGWLVKLESRLPEFDNDGRLGFVAGAKLVGADPTSAGAKQLAPKKLSFPGDTKSWFVPKDADLGGVTAVAGAELTVATRGLGWFATVALPKPGKTVDSDADDQVWGLREDHYNRGALAPEFVQRVRD